MTQLVTVFLRGGADGLSLLAPVGDPAYHRARPTQALAERSVLDVGVDGFGLHPGAPRLAELFRSGRVAAVPAAGFEGQSRSHFDAQALLEAGAAATTAAGTGWLGRLLAHGAGSTPAPFRGVAVGGISLPPSLWGTPDALGVPDPTALRLGALRAAGRRVGGYEVVDSPLAPDVADLVASWSAAAPSAPGVAVAGTRAAAAVLDAVASAPALRVDPSGFGDGEAAQTFAAASALLDAGLGTELVQVDLGGWDTHDAQGTADGTFARLVTALDAGVGALVDRHGGRDEGLVVLVITEFGRRVQENASGGTDHGRGGLALVVGDGVAGGLHGAWPGLDDLDDGDVRAVNDLRSLQAEVAAVVGGLDAAALDAVVPSADGSPRPTLGVLSPR